MRELLKSLVQKALQKGASYADARVQVHRIQNISVEDTHVHHVEDNEDIGFSVRVLKNGAWGTASGFGEGEANLEAALDQALSIASSSALVQKEPVRLVEEDAYKKDFASPFQEDPFEVPLPEKANLLIRCGEIALGVKDIKKFRGHFSFRKVTKSYANSEGSDFETQMVITAPFITAVAVGHGDAQIRNYEPPIQSAGFEIIRAAEFEKHAERIAHEAVEKLYAPQGPSGTFDLILDPGHLALTIHESVGHATELDRVLGMEESLAGRSFAKTHFLNNLQYGSNIVNFVADNTLPQGLATQGYDDDGVPGKRWHIVQDGTLVHYSTSREVAGKIGAKRSMGCNRADSWQTTPIVRIPNLSLMAGTTSLSPEELMADTKDGIYIEGRGSYSIDQMRQNFQFGGDAFWRIKDGKKVEMLKNVTYQSITVPFWNSCDAICSQEYWEPHGVLNCGKGDPIQISQMTHGAATARFRQITVGG